MRAVAPRTGAPEATLAEEQPDFTPITIAMYQSPHLPWAKIFLSRWKLTAEDRDLLLNGEDVYVGIVLGENDLMPPLQVQIGPAGYLLSDPEGPPA